MEKTPFSFLPTFRDPAGSVEIRPDGVYRTIRTPFDVEIASFLELPFAQQLVADGRLVASEVVSPPDAENLILRHPRISFQSYPLGVVARSVARGRRIDP